MNLEKLQYTRGDAAKLLSISVDKLDELRARGKIKEKRIDSRVYITAAELEAFVTKEEDVC